MYVEIVESMPQWCHEFNTERDRLEEVMGELAERIEHIGSTSVPGLGAKPVVDIQVGISTLEDFHTADGISVLESAGYTYMPEFEKIVPFRRLFVREDNGTRLNNLHVVETDHPWFHRHLYFRDYLRISADARGRYEAVKRNLAAQEWEKMPDYAKAKNDIVEALEEEAYEHFGLEEPTKDWLRNSRV